MHSTNALHLSARDRQFLYASPSLLAGTRIVFGSLLNGGSVHCFSPEILRGPDFAEALGRRGITIVRSVAPLFRHAVDTLAPGGSLDTLRLVFLGGDRVDWADYDLFCRACGDEAVFGTHLGSTECSTVYLMWLLKKGVAHGDERLSVGRNVPDREVTIVGDDGAPVADGEVGEFKVASRHLALGYWRDTAPYRFGNDLIDPSIRTFLTGDLGLRRADGFYEFRGRKDQQVKIRGQRVEPGEVERALRDCQGIEEAAVIVRRSEQDVPQALVAYVELKPGVTGMLPRHVRAMAERRLAFHQMPASFYILPNLPRLPNIKVDRVALAEVDRQHANRGSEHSDDPLTRTIARLFEEVIEVEGATADDNVFSLGGDSFQALELQHLIEDKFALRLPKDLISRAPTIREIAEFVASRAP
jgi:acyl-coenzyme A synthetase/AMP-(fatty) acid ligase/acyl carrier protein